MQLATNLSNTQIAIQFNCGLLRAQYQALDTLREIMSDTAGDPFDGAASPPSAEDYRRVAAENRRLSLRLRAATTILRIKPVSETQDDNSPAFPHAIDENLNLLVSAITTLQKTAAPTPILTRKPGTIGPPNPKALTLQAQAGTDQANKSRTP